ncbi:MAG TPA: recombinase family protein [Pirellulales bacterium]|nr:recombinase family protein [Pirellulales bacterium]
MSRAPKVIGRLDSGDVLVVTRLDRLARSTRDLLNVIAAITERGAGFKSLRDAWADTTSPHGRLMLTVLQRGAAFGTANRGTYHRLRARAQPYQCCATVREKSFASRAGNPLVRRDDAEGPIGGIEPAWDTLAARRPLAPVLGRKSALALPPFIDGKTQQTAVPRSAPRSIRLGAVGQAGRGGSEGVRSRVVQAIRGTANNAASLSALRKPAADKVPL